MPDGRIRLTQLETETVMTDITTIDGDGRVQSYNGSALERVLQQAFAEANAGLRQANTIIGDYRMVDAEDTDTGVETAVNGSGQPHYRPRLLVNGASSHGRVPLKPALLGNGNGKMNGNGHASQQDKTPDGKSAQKTAQTEKPAAPPVPRPRFIGII